MHLIKKFLSVIFICFFLTSLNGQKSQRQLVPYLVGEKYGISDLEGNLIIDAEYELITINNVWAIIKAQKAGKKYIFKANGELLFEAMSEKIDIKQLSPEGNIFELYFTKSNKYYYVNPFTDSPIVEVLNKKPYVNPTYRNGITDIKTDDGLVLLDKSGKEIKMPGAYSIDHYNCVSIVKSKDRNAIGFFNRQGENLGDKSEILGLSNNVNRVLFVDENMNYFLDKSCAAVDSCANCTYTTFNDTLFFKMDDDLLEIRNLENEVVQSFSGKDISPIRNELYDKFAYKKVGNGYKLIDAESNVIDRFNFNSLKLFTNDVIILNAADSLFFLDANQNVLSVLPSYEVFTTPKQWDNELFWVSSQVNGKYLAAVLNSKGQVVLEPFTEDLLEINQSCGLISANKDSDNYLFDSNGKLLYQSSNSFRNSCQGDSVIIEEDGKLFAFHRNYPTDIVSKTRKKKPKSKYRHPSRVLEDSLNLVFDEVGSPRGISGVFITRKGKSIKIVTDSYISEDLPFDTIPKSVKLNSFYFGLEMDVENKDYMIFHKDGTYINRIKGYDLHGYWGGYTYSLQDFIVARSGKSKRFFIDLKTLKEYRKPD